MRVRRSALFGSVLVVVAALHVLGGVQVTMNSVYSTELGVFEQFMNGAIRLLFALLVSVLAAGPLVAQLRGGFIAGTRTRASIGSTITRHTVHGVARAVAYMAVIGILTAITVALLVRVLRPTVVDPEGYGLSTTAAARRAAEQNPLGQLLVLGAPAFDLGAVLWMTTSAAVVAVIAIACALLIRRPVVALLAPVALVLGESVLMQVLGLPQFALLVALPFPSSLSRFGLLSAALPASLFAIAAIGTIMASWATARRRGAFT